MKATPCLMVTALVFALSLSTASAVEYSKGDLSLQADSRVTLGAAWRLRDADLDNVGIINGGRAFSTNGDDGNIAFDRGDPISQAVKITTDFSADWRGFGVFLRGTYKYDQINNNKQFYNDNFYQGAPAFTQNRQNLENKRDLAYDEIGSNAELLDAYAYGGFDIFDRYLSFRIGKQVINWGESTFIQNGLKSIVALNANAIAVPGFDVKELFRPAAAAWFSVDIIENVSMEAFYQWKWEKTEIPVSGSFFASNDYAGIGGNGAEIGFGRCPENSAPGACGFAFGGSNIPRRDDIEPDDGGQYGVAFNWFAEQLNETEFGFYYANYHSRLPLFSGNAVVVPGVPGTGGVSVQYPEDIKLYGMSFNTPLPGGWVLQGEYSRKEDQPLQIEDVELFLAGLRVGAPSQIGPFGPGEFIQGWRPFDVDQLNLSVTKVFGPFASIGSDQMIFLFEAGAMSVKDMPSTSVLRFEAPATFTPGNATVAAGSGVPQQIGGYADDTSWGYNMLFRFEYNNVFNRINLNPTILFAHDVNGTSPTPILNFIEDRKRLTLALTGTYLSAWDAGVSFNRFFGGGIANQIQDRDFVSAHVGYSF